MSAGQTYPINHVHIRSTDPLASAAWYENHFNARIMSSREVMPGTITVSMDVGGPVRLNISSQPAGSSSERTAAELYAINHVHIRSTDRLSPAGPGGPTDSSISASESKIYRRSWTDSRAPAYVSYCPSRRSPVERGWPTSKAPMTYSSSSSSPPEGTR